MSVQVGAFRQALATLHSCPETTVGEAVVRFCRAEILCEFALRDVGDQADMRAGGLDGMETSEQLEEDGGGVGFAVRGQAAYGQPRDAVECGIAEDWIRGRTGWRLCGRRRAGL
jgi:hypothetical protein